jgi:hypothetical protein
VRDGRLVEVSEVVELVAVDLLEDPALLSRPRVRLLRVDRARRVQVSVGLLRGGDLLDQPVDVASSFGSGWTLSV